jgi:sulfite reductase (ferredoxin)
VKDLKIKISGCFNSCGQHHVADIGFYGVSRKAGGRTVPHFQVVLGGQARENAGAFGLAIGAVPSRRIPDALLSITDLYRAERESGESFRRFVERVGKGRIKTLLQDLTRVPAYEVDRTLYSDWGDPREYTTGDMGKGECAGEVVSQLDFGLAAAERMSFEAQLQLDAGNPAEAIDLAYRSMLKAAWALVRDEFLDVGEEPERIVEEFRARFFDTGRFHDPFAGSKFASYFFAAHAARSGADGNTRPADARQRLEEAQLFIEAAYACQGRLVEANAPGAGNGSGNGAGNGRGNGAGPVPTSGTGGGNGRSTP